MKKVTATLDIKVSYDLNGADAGEVLSILGRAAEYLLDNGLLSGESKAEVNNCTHKITLNNFE